MWMNILESHIADNRMALLYHLRVQTSGMDCCRVTPAYQVGREFG